MIFPPRYWIQPVLSFVLLCCRALLIGSLLSQPASFHQPASIKWLIYHHNHYQQQQKQQNSRLSSRNLNKRVFTTIDSSSYETLNRLDFKNTVRVFDGVFPRDTCQELHYLALDHSARNGGKSSIFYCNENHHLSPLEHAIASCVRQLYCQDDTQPTKKGDENETLLTSTDRDMMIVEYWSREDYINMDAHSDIDELLLGDEGILRFPDFGHVLYLEIDPKIRGPTVVFSQYGGWTATNDNEGKQIEKESLQLLTVPAVSGRILRFPGSAMHAVPKPPTLWFQSPEKQEEILEAEDCNYRRWDEGEDEDDIPERSVILFNVWLKQGPTGVAEDYYSKRTMPDGIELVDDENNDDKSFGSTEQEKDRRRAQWDEDSGIDCYDLWCRPRSDWREAQILDNSGQPTDDNIVIPLMGSRVRRLCSSLYVHLFSSSRLRNALQDESNPQMFQALQKP